MIHLRMSGQLLLAPRRRSHARRTPTSCARGLEGEPPAELWFVDPRTFGEVVVFDPANVAVEVPELARLGVDPVADGARPGRRSRALLRPTTRQMKALLLDQHVIAGIGNIYADEMLHRAKLRYDRPRRRR